MPFDAKSFIKTYRPRYNALFLDFLPLLSFASAAHKFIARQRR